MERVSCLGKDNYSSRNDTSHNLSEGAMECSSPVCSGYQMQWHAWLWTSPQSWSVKSTEVLTGAFLAGRDGGRPPPWPRHYHPLLYWLDSLEQATQLFSISGTSGEIITPCRCATRDQWYNTYKAQARYQTHGKNPTLVLSSSSFRDFTLDISMMMSSF